jgi:hypothetical protein
MEEIFLFPPHDTAHAMPTTISQTIKIYIYIYEYQNIFTKRSLTGRGTSSQHHLSKEQRTTFYIGIFA